MVRHWAVLGVLLLLLACAAADAGASKEAPEAPAEQQARASRPGVEDSWPEDIVKTGEKTGLGSAGSVARRRATLRAGGLALAPAPRVVALRACRARPPPVFVVHNKAPLMRKRKRWAATWSSCASTATKRRSRVLATSSR